MTRKNSKETAEKKNYQYPGSSDKGKMNRIEGCALLLPWLRVNVNGTDSWTSFMGL